jgi:hypothetical protein
MTDPTLWLAARQATARAEQQHENSARYAISRAQFVSLGVGTSNGTVTFEIPYVDEPVVSTGVVLERAPDTTRWRMPQVTAGVLRWTTTQSGPTTLYIGAQMYVVVDCEPHYIPRTDGSDLKRLQAQLAAAKKQGADQVTIANLTMHVREAQDALDLAAHLPSYVRVRHHLTFTGTGIKATGLDAKIAADSGGRTAIPTGGASAPGI